jgi:MarR-like DNA-binding transcriptional regulator SgrR of sgrS sRNA
MRRCLLLQAGLIELMQGLITSLTVGQLLQGQQLRLYRFTLSGGHESDSEARDQALHQLYHQLMRAGILLPLFNYRYQIYARVFN